MLRRFPHTYTLKTHYADNSHDDYMEVVSFVLDFQLLTMPHGLASLPLHSTSI